MSCKLVNCVLTNTCLLHSWRTALFPRRISLIVSFISVRDVLLHVSQTNKANLSPLDLFCLHTFGVTWNGISHSCFISPEGVLVIILSGVPCTLICFFAIPSEKALLDQLTNKIGKSFCKVKRNVSSKHAEDTPMFVLSLIIVNLMPLLIHQQISWQTCNCNFSYWCVWLDNATFHYDQTRR